MILSLGSAILIITLIVVLLGGAIWEWVWEYKKFH